MPRTAFVNGQARLLAFRLGSERFAVSLTDVEEVIEAPVVQRIPEAAPTVVGMATIRGTFIVIYDPRPLLRVGGRIDGAALLFMHAERRVGLAVDDVLDALTVTEDEMRPPPAVGAGVGGLGGRGAIDTLLIGMIRRGSDLIAVIDAHALLDAAIGAHVEGGERAHT